MHVSTYYQEYDSTMSIYTTESHKSIKKGDSELFLLETFITAPMAGLKFNVKQPLGYTVRISRVFRLIAF